MLISRIDLSELMQAFSRVSSWALVAAFVTLFAQMIVNAFRWMFVMGFFSISAKFLLTLKITLISVLVNQGLPSFLGGDALRVYWLNRGGNELREAAFSVLVDRLLGLIGLVVIMAIGAPVFGLWFGLTALSKAVILLAIVAVGGVVFFFILPEFMGFAKRFRLAQELCDISLQSRRLVCSPRSGGVVITQSLTIHMLGILVFYFLALGYGLELSYWQMIVVVPPVILISVLPISIAGWGVRESGMIAALGMFGVSSETALAISVTFGGLVLLLGLCGLPFLLVKPDKSE